MHCPLCLGIGVDIVEVGRIKGIVEEYGRDFLEKAFTDDEIDYCYSKAKPFQHIAGRFAAKEAVIKAANTLEELAPHQIEIQIGDNGAPSVSIHDAQRLSGAECQVSISHSENFAVAMAVVIKAEEGPA